MTYREALMEVISPLGGGGGGGGASVEPLSVTANGTYVAQEGTAYSPVTVAVPVPSLVGKYISSNGTYSAPSGQAYSSVTVSVPSGPVPSSAVRPPEGSATGYYLRGVATSAMHVEDVRSAYVNGTYPTWYVTFTGMAPFSGSRLCLYRTDTDSLGRQCHVAIWGIVSAVGTEGRFPDVRYTVTFSSYDGFAWCPASGTADGEAWVKAGIDYVSADGMTIHALA